MADYDLDLLNEIVQYKTSTQPRSRSEHPTENEARDKWKRAGAVAKRAGSDDTSETDGEDHMTREQREQYKRKKREAKAEREKIAKVMGLEYFLEMVDHKHRYGSNLRAYHRAWQQSGTRENFFYWLDYGEGTQVDLEDRPRKRLDEEQVRYLSREERRKYLVIIDSQGFLCWAKNGERITTSPDYRDSMEGIVPISDHETPTWRDTTGRQVVKESLDESGSDSEISVGSNEDASRYVNQELHDAKGLGKLKHITAGTVSNNLMRKTTKKNTWIFVADTSFRLYIGIKQSGAFQHSSFLHGARVAAAGLIRIKRGQLRRLSPLSGHYSPPVENFKSFVSNMKEAGADMSHVNISRSYSVLVGLEAYLGVKSTIKKSGQHVKDMLNPEEAKRREEQQRDHSKSAEKERAVLEAQAQEEAKLKRQQSLPTRLVKKLGGEARLGHSPSEKSQPA
ncbi:hypothetical protein MBLNU459_g7422t1 [Dothideomycetes sp. NU459]